jgi:energy-coupling factor transporter ATP-binding protein EcfA2
MTATPGNCILPRGLGTLGISSRTRTDQLFEESVWDDVAFGLRNLHVPGPELETHVEATLRPTGPLGTA